MLTRNFWAVIILISTIYSLRIQEIHAQEIDKLEKFQTSQISIMLFINNQIIFPDWTDAITDTTGYKEWSEKLNIYLSKNVSQRRPIDLLKDIYIPHFEHSILVNSKNFAQYVIFIENFKDSNYVDSNNDSLKLKISIMIKNNEVLEFFIKDRIKINQFYNKIGLRLSTFEYFLDYIQNHK